MIPLSEINAFSEKWGVPAETIEKDYVISWILHGLSKNLLKQDFIFYGGTAIKRVYFEEHRFSEDIDLLSYKKFPLDYILQHLLFSFETVRNETNLSLNFNKNNIIFNNDRVQMLISYLGYEDIIGAPKEIRLDFIMDMEPYGTIKKAKIIETYSDLKGNCFNFNVMTLNTILANKFGLLLDRTRNEPRDLFDIWFLLQRLDKFDFNLSNLCKTFKEKYGFRISGKLMVSNLKNSSFKNKWTMRLGAQLPILPTFEKVITEIEVKIKELFFEEFNE